MPEQFCPEHSVMLSAFDFGKVKSVYVLQTSLNDELSLKSDSNMFNHETISMKHSRDVVGLWSELADATL